VKGVGEGAVEAIVAARSEGGAFVSIHDLMRRVLLRSANRKALESLAYAGAFDGFAKTHRAQFFHSAGEGRPTFMETLTRYGQQHQDGEDSSQVNMFDSGTEGASIPEPALPNIDPWSALEKLHHEKEVVGFYLSGHPLDDHRLEIKHLCNNNLSQLVDLKALSGREVSLAGIVTKAEHRIAKSGKPFGTFSMEDHFGNHDFMLFSEDYLKYKVYLQQGALLYVKGRAMERTWGRDEGQMEFKIMQMDLLSDVREKYITKLNLKIEAERVSDDLTRELNELLRAAPGKCKLRLTLFSNDAHDPLTVDLPSKYPGVVVSEDLMERLAAIADVEVRLG